MTGFGILRIVVIRLLSLRIPWTIYLRIVLPVRRVTLTMPANNRVGNSASTGAFGGSIRLARPTSYLGGRNGAPLVSMRGVRAQRFSHRFIG